MYRLCSLRGLFDSDLQEHQDMIRSSFIKYKLEHRVGRMDVALVAHHNATELLALEYEQLQKLNHACPTVRG